MIRLTTLVLVLILIVVGLVFTVGCSPFESPTEGNLQAAVDSGDFYIERLSDTLVYIYLEGTHSPSLEMAYVTQQLELLDNSYQVLDVELTIYRQWIWSPVIVILGGQR